jgi:hypothetical protein
VFLTVPHGDANGRRGARLSGEGDLKIGNYRHRIVMAALSFAAMCILMHAMVNTIDDV